MYRLSILFAVITGFAVLSISAVAQTDSTKPPEYKEFARTTLSRNYFDLCRTSAGLGVVVYSPSGDRRETFPKNQLRVRDGNLYAGDRLLLDTAALHAGDTTLPLSQISSAQVIDAPDSIILRFSARTDSVPDFSRIRRGNRIGSSQNVSVAEKDFVRGMIFTTTGKIEVWGEVNKDVLSVFGDIHAGEGAKLRGDAVSLFGKVKIEPEAAVYGHVIGGQDSKARRHRLTVREKNFEVYPRFVYNRVDGATPMVGAHFVDTDSTLPKLKLEIGYAFASKRLRWRASAEQTLMRKPALSVGGSYGHWLATDDDRLLSDVENTVFALVAREDFKDYYETTFGEIFFRSRPIPRLTGELAFRYDDSRYFRSHPHLWSLFGGDKVFRQNWSTVDSAYRARGVQEIDTARNSTIRLTVTFDSRFLEKPFDSSAWNIVGQGEWSVKGFDSDWGYSRYLLSARRYQVVTHYTTLLLSGTYGNSDGYLPMYKRFFLGGLGTLQGYDHKEYMGTRFWLGSAEYHIRFRHSTVAFSLLWDVGQIANDTRFSVAEVKHSLGAAMYLGDAVRISLARRLDRSSDANPKVYVRLQHSF